jgi:N-acetylneuraminic acid mutarotase
LARVLGATSFVLLLSAAAAQAQPGPWHTGTAGPPARYRCGGASDGTSIYVFGGGNAAATFQNDLWRWDWATETWTQLANLPTGKQNIQGTYWNGKIYVPGGFTTVHLTENAIYDIATNTWSTGAPLPVARTGATVAFANKVFVFGGNPGPTNETRIYDIATNTWSLGANMPVATTYGRAIAVGNFAYYVGGIAGGVTTNAVHRYDLVGNTWTTLAPLQTARTSEELATDGTRIYAINGGDATFFTGIPIAQTVEIYDIAGNTWTFGQQTLVTSAGPGGGLAPGPGGKFMIHGGTSGTQFFADTQVSTNTTPVELMNFKVE